MSININFVENHDKITKLNDIIIKEISEFLFSDDQNISYLVNLNEILRKFNTYDQFVSSRFITRFTEENNLDSHDIRFLELISNLFKTEDSNIRAIKEGLLTRIIATLISERYLKTKNNLKFPLNDQYMSGCELKASCSIQFPSINWSSQNYDYIGALNHNLNKGECYKCVISYNEINPLDKSELEKVHDTINVMTKNSINFRLGIVTLDDSIIVRLFLSLPKNIIVIGRNNIMELVTNNC